MHRRNLRYWMELDIKKSQKSPAASSIYNIWSCVPSAQVIAEQFLHHHFYPLALAWRWRPVQKFHKKNSFALSAGNVSFSPHLVFVCYRPRALMAIFALLVSTNVNVVATREFWFPIRCSCSRLLIFIGPAILPKSLQSFQHWKPHWSKKNNTILNFCVEENLSQG